jgi:hypothetical protein
MAGKPATGPGGSRFTGMPARGESSQALLGAGRKAVSLMLLSVQATGSDWRRIHNRIEARGDDRDAGENHSTRYHNFQCLSAWT